MNLLSKFWGRGAICFYLCLIILPAYAQSQKSLEAAVLGETTTTAQSNISTVPEADQIDVEVPELVPEKEPEVSGSDLKEIEEAVRGPKEIPRDHILVVQRRYIRKAGRHELSPFFVGIQPADSFRKQIQWGMSYTYHFTESLAIEALNFSIITNYSTGLDDTLATLPLGVDRIEPVLSLGSTFQWTPLRSKAAGQESIFYFEGFFLGGGGMTKHESTTSAMAMAGLGFRLYMSRDAIIKTEFRDYIDFRNSASEHRFNILFGLSLLLGAAK